jgi:hypothetical protein
MLDKLRQEAAGDPASLVIGIYNDHALVVIPVERDGDGSGGKGKDEG